MLVLPLFSFSTPLSISIACANFSSSKLFTGQFQHIQIIMQMFMTLIQTLQNETEEILS